MSLSLLLTILGIASAALVLLTVVVEVNDLPRPPGGAGLGAHVRRHLQAIGLVLVGTGAGMTGFRLLAGQPVELLPLALVLGVALSYLSRSPGWWHYVLAGDRRTSHRDGERRSA